ncbi:MAG: flagellar basal body rod C-terminal domain-containing protein, partial [Mariprofundus sp.]|nr:flagellar basal body rod C-terminal domain-containing protein [Mariprofundus sp.]
GTALPGSYGSIVIAGTQTPVSIASQGGEIGGMIDLRDNKLETYINQLDNLAANLIFSVNQLHSNGASPIHHTSITAEQSSNAALAVDNATQAAAFASQIQSGSFKLHVYDNTGAAISAGGTTISITAGTSTMTSIAASINAVVGVTASIDRTGHLNIAAATGNTFSLSNDTSNVLAAYEINNFFHGGNAASIKISNNIANNASAINTGQVDATTSAIYVADNSIALSILALQNTALNVEGGATSASLHDRTTTLSTQYGTDVGIAKQQKDFRTVELQSLQNQRQAISGVNVDEELISMIKFQRAYQASAKIITTSNQMLDSLLGLIR